MQEIAIIAEGLSKRFQQVTAVESISFTVARGQTVALLGGNGAGKTTTLSMVLGLLLPSAGKVSLFGHDMAHERTKVAQRMNFASPYVELPRRLTVQQNLLVFARLYGLKAPRARVEQLAQDLDFTDLLKRPFGRLSAGQKTRVALAKALINEPQILILDEPTASLDPDTADWLRSYLEAYQQRQQAAILLASHNMAEVERLCDQVLIMKAGSIVAEGSPKELIERFGRDDLEEVFLDIARNRRQGAEAA